MTIVEQEIVRSGTCKSLDGETPIHIVRDRRREPYDYVTFYVVVGELAGPPYPIRPPGFLSVHDATHHAQEHVLEPIAWRS
jgi:hypothetical protein